MCTLFISDCHLDSTRPRVIEYFKHFLNDEACRADALYILGDLFEEWVGDDYTSPDVESIINALHHLSRQTPVYFLHGNRDFLVGGHFAEKSGCTLLRQPIVINIESKPILIMHGDRLCTDDYAYQCYRSVAHNPLTKAIYNSMSLNLRCRIAQGLRRKSANAMEKKKPEIMDVNENTVIRYMSRFGVSCLIHGHTHRPAIHQVKLGDTFGTRAVLGDWDKQASFLSIKDGEMELVQTEIK